MKKLMAFFLCLVLSFSLLSNAGTTEAYAQQRSGKVALPELANTIWCVTQLSKGEEVETSGLYGFWDTYRFNADGTGYVIVERFDGQSATVDFTWKKVSNTKAEMIISNEAVELNFDGRFLSYTRPSIGITTQMVSNGSDQELYWKMMTEKRSFTFTGEKKTDGVSLSGLFKPIAVFFIDENGALQYYMYNDLTIQPSYLLQVSGGDDEGEPCDVYLFETANNFGHVTNYQQGNDTINSDASLKKYAAYGIAPENGTISNFTLQTGEGEERVITSFYRQAFSTSYVLQMDGVNFICMPLN